MVQAMGSSAAGGSVGRVAGGEEVADGGSRGTVQAVGNKIQRTAMHPQVHAEEWKAGRSMEGQAGGTGRRMKRRSLILRR